MDAKIDRVQNNWPQIKGPLRRQWAQLSYDDLDTMEGTVGELAVVLQRRYGYNSAKAEQEINMWLNTRH